MTAEAAAADPALKSFLKRVLEVTFGKNDTLKKTLKRWVCGCGFSRHGGNGALEVVAN